MSIDVDFVTAQVTVDNRWALVMKVTEALEYLFTPFLYCSQLQVLVLGSEFPQIARSEILCDEIDTVLLFVCPAFEASNDIGMIQINSNAHLCCYLMYLLFIKLIGFPLYFAPGYINALLLIKTFVYTLEPALTNYMVISAKPAFTQLLCQPHFAFST